MIFKIFYLDFRIELPIQFDRYDNIDFKLMLINTSSAKKNGRGASQQFTRFNYLEDNFEKYNYPIQPYDEQQELNFDYQKEPFSFDNQGYNNRSNYQYELTPFGRSNNSQTIAKDLIEQNSILKQKLKQSEQIIKQLQKQLEICHYDLNDQEVESKREKQSFQKTISQLRQEIMSIIQSNSILQRQILSLSPFLNHKSSCSDNKISVKESRSLGKIIPKINHVSNNSYNDDLNQEKKKAEQLIDSINSMHSKIMGFRAENLRQLWRWLKNMGQVYSSLRKWSEKYGDIGHHSRLERFKEAISQAFSLIS